MNIRNENILKNINISSNIKPMILKTKKKPETSTFFLKKKKTSTKTGFQKKSVIMRKMKSHEVILNDNQKREIMNMTENFFISQYKIGFDIENQICNFKINDNSTQKYKKITDIENLRSSNRRVSIKNENILISSQNTSYINIEDKLQFGKIEILKDLLLNNYKDISFNLPGNFEEYSIGNLSIIGVLNGLEYKNNQYINLGLNNTELKKTLILDLDETLIHADIDNIYPDCDFQIEIELNQIKALIKIILRPYLYDLLEYASEFFNIIVFTAGTKDYADKIIDYIDPNKKYIKNRLYRDSCFEFHNFYIKDLNLISDIDLKQVIIVDNCIFSFMKNLRNGILVTSFYNNKSDDELRSLCIYLKDFLLNADDFREVNECFYGFESTKEYLLNQIA